MLHAGHPIVFTNNIFGPTIIRTHEPCVHTITTIIRTLEPSVHTITTNNHPDARAVRPYNKHKITIMEKAKVLETIKAAGEPINAGKVAELSGLDRKIVDKAMKQLKEEGEIISPKRCYWTAK